MIDERFGVRGRDGVDFEILGGTQGVPGGGFLYTNLDTLAVGRRAQAAGARRAAARGPRRSSPGLKAHPAIAPLVEGGELKEYSRPPHPRGRLDA